MAKMFAAKMLVDKAVHGRCHSDETGHCWEYLPIFFFTPAVGTGSSRRSSRLRNSTGPAHWHPRCCERPPHSPLLQLHAKPSSTVRAITTGSNYRVASLPPRLDCAFQEEGFVTYSPGSCSARHSASLGPCYWRKGGRGRETGCNV